MSESGKISPEALEQNKDVFLEELEKALHLNDFVWVENTKPKIMQELDNKNDKKQSEISNTSILTISQYEGFKESSSDTVFSQNKYSNGKKTDGEAVVPSDLDKELLVEQEYWEQNGSAAKKMNNLKSKSLTSQRMTLKEHKIIDKTMTTPRHPSYYQFGIATTDLLEMFLKKDYVGGYLNVAGRGLNSVVIYSPNNPAPVRTRYQCGIAVKVYKLSCDVRKNSTILKKVQKEHDNMKTLEYSWFVPEVVHMYKNVTVMEFIGYNQETAPSINSLPLEKSKEMYHMTVKELHDWYKLKIVHGKLSSKYIRLCWDRLYVLGWSHSVRTDHPQALKKLMRDCLFVNEFFKRRGVPVTSTEELFKSISGVDKLSRTLLDVMYGKNLWQDHHVTNPNRTSDDQCRPHSTSRFKA